MVGSILRKTIRDDGRRDGAIAQLVQLENVFIEGVPMLLGVLGAALRARISVRWVLEATSEINKVIICFIIQGVLFTLSARVLPHWSSLILPRLL